MGPSIRIQLRTGHSSEVLLEAVESLLENRDGVSVRLVIGFPHMAPLNVAGEEFLNSIDLIDAE